MQTISIQKKEKAVFIWRISALHTIAYFIAGLFALTFMYYSNEQESEAISKLMLPEDHWQVAVGLGLQPLRGAIIAFVLWPFRETIFSNRGWIKLAFLILGLSYLSTLGPAIGSFNGYIFTNVSLKYHLLGIPEALIYVFTFTYLIFFWYKYPWRGVSFMFAIFVGFILLISLLGFFDSYGLIKEI